VGATAPAASSALFLIATLFLVTAPAAAVPTGEGAVAPFGRAIDHGSPGPSATGGVVGMAATPSGSGYWLASANGGVFAYGDAPFHGSAAAGPLNQPVIDIVATPSGQGYWLVAADGGIFSYGNARFLGSTGALPLNQPVVGMAATPSGNGYWLAAADGGIFSYGDAAFHGSLGGQALRAPIVGVTATHTGGGYWLVGADGGLFAFGDAGFHGSLGGQALRAPIVALHADTTDGGYVMAAADGGVFAFGDAPFHGSLASGPATAPVVDIAGTPSGDGYWLATGRPRLDLGLFIATCYALRGTTATGRPVGSDVIAVDRRVIPLGTRLYVEGVGERVAADTGGAIVGRRIDVWRPTATECGRFGRQSLRVWRVA
jgi:3D (Asp-Asp-Asp) domain-containing protein